MRTYITNDRLLIAVGVLFTLAILLLTRAPFLHASPALTGEYYVIPDTPAMPDGNAYTVSFKPDTSYVAVAQDTADAGLSIVDTDTLSTVDDVPEPAGAVNTVKFSQDGHYLAVGGDNLTIIDSSAADPASWTIVQSTPNEDASEAAFAFSPDGTYLAVSYDTSATVRVRIFRTSDWSEVLNDGDPFDFGVGYEHVTDLAFTQDSQYLVLGVETGGIGPNLVAIHTDGWTTVDGVPQVDAIDASSLSFSPDGTHLAVSLIASSGDYHIAILDTSDANPASWTIAREFDPNDTGDSTGIAFSPDGKTLAAAYSGSPFFGITDTSSSDPADWVGIDTSATIGELPGGKSGNSGQAVAYSSDGTIIAVAQGGGPGLVLIRTTVDTTPPPPPVVHHHSSGGGSTVQNQAAFLTQNGNSAAADALKAQFPQAFGASDVSGGTSTNITARDLQFGMQGDDVKALQTLLIAQGYAIPAGATGYFGNQTRAALSAYQTAHGITPAAGYFGAITRAAMKSLGLGGIWW